MALSSSLSGFRKSFKLLRLLSMNVCVCCVCADVYVRAYTFLCTRSCALPAMPVGLTDDVWQVCGVSPLVGTRWGWKMPLSFYILQHIFLLLSAFFLFMLWPATIAAGLWWSIGRLTLKQQKISSPVYIQTHRDMVTPGLLHITLDRIFTPVVKSDETICWGCFVSIIQLSCRWNRILQHEQGLLKSEQLDHEKHEMQMKKKHILWFVWKEFTVNGFVHNFDCHHIWIFLHNEWV